MSLQAGAGTWPSELGLTAAQTQELLLLCADVLRASKVRVLLDDSHIHRRLSRHAQVCDSACVERRIHASCFDVRRRRG